MNNKRLPVVLLVIGCLQSNNNPLWYETMKSVVVGIRLPQDAKDKLQQLADEEHRSLSNLISKIVLDYLKDKDIEGKEETPPK